MKAKLISIFSVFAIGVLVLFLTISNYTSVENSYNTNLEKARENAEKLIPYNAYNYYKQAFAVRCDDETIYQEFMEQAKLLGDSYYNAAIKDYVVKFPA